MCVCVSVLVAQLCPILCNPMDCSLPGSSVHEILQARMLEWGAFPSPGEHPDPGTEPVSPAAPALQVDSLPTELSRNTIHLKLLIHFLKL